MRGLHVVITCRSLPIHAASVDDGASKLPSNDCLEASAVAEESTKRVRVREESTAQNNESALNAAARGRW